MHKHNIHLTTSDKLQACFDNINSTSIKKQVPTLFPADKTNSKLIPATQLDWLVSSSNGSTKDIYAKLVEKFCNQNSSKHLTYEQYMAILACFDSVTIPVKRSFISIFFGIVCLLAALIIVLTNLTLDWRIIAALLKIG